MQQIAPRPATVAVGEPVGATPAVAAPAARDAFVRRAVGKDRAAANSLAFVVPHGFKLGDKLHAELDHSAKTREGSDVVDVYEVCMHTPADLGEGREFTFACEPRVDRSGKHAKEGGLFKPKHPEGALVNKVR
jgi:hypothetical protein